MIRRCHDDGVEKVRVHVLLDGRDVPETSALEYVEPLEALLGEMRDAGRDYRIASGGGRMRITMDRYEADWEMVHRGYEIHVHGKGRGFPSATEAIRTYRDESPGVSDQNLPGFVVVDTDGTPVGPIGDGAAVVFFNFRGDRAIEISRAFEEDAFGPFDRGDRPDVAYAGMMQYDGDLQIPRHYLVQPPSIDRTLGEYLARNRLAQLACSETQKYGHVTYFWNGNRSGRFNEQLETYIEIPSDTLPFEERPWMKAAEITDAVIRELLTGEYRHARLNYANGDMVGHTGVLESAVQAVEAVDLCVGRLLPVIDKLGGALLVTADHGNADEMYEHDKKTGAISRSTEGKPKAKTSHTLNPVPLHVYAPGHELSLATDLEKPGLANLAATVLHLCGYARPDGYQPSVIAG
jgi:2,3-bisphosphoglycerate-independent phosphoglycerate mutase